MMRKSPKSTPVPIAIALSLTLMGDSFLYAVLPTQAVALGIPLASVGILLSLNRFVRFFTNQWAGYVYGKGEREKPFFWATVAATASTWAYALPWGFWVFLLARALWGTSYSFLRLGNYLSVLERTKKSERGRWLGQTKAINRVAITVATALGGYLTDAIGYHFSVGIFGTLTACGTLIAFREMRRSQQSQHAEAPLDQLSQEEEQIEGDTALENDAVLEDDAALEKDSTSIQGSVDESKDESKNEPELKSKPRGYIPRKERLRLLVTFFGSFTHGLVTHGLVTGTVALLLMQRYGEDVSLLGFTVGVATLSGIVLGVRWFADIVIAPLGGRLADRMSRRLIVVLSAFLQAIALISVALSHLPVMTITSIWTVYIAAMLFALSLESIAGGIGMKGDLSSVMSRYSTVQDIGAALGPSVGFSLGIALGLKTLYLCAAGVLALVGFLFWRQRPSRTSISYSPTQSV